MTRTTDLEALGEYVYGKEWRTIAANEPHWDILMKFAAEKQLREVLSSLKLVVQNQGELPESISLSVSGNNGRGESPHGHVWSEQTDREVKTRCATMLKEMFEVQGVKVEVRDGNEELT